ncbi:hypothetical protein Dthio_PD2079 [Desulfonatronospira thiodismutans ASO3-1]|uniref:Uncharacterized protein n=1 Tax=Desulfonatronospira thiodismutans ASO3-1 TaxID=555779 RepID=D6SPN1_9BACT|nr:hypothetical protein [Desulfonatronospira thiodismutans]EFI34707.1 hypothetical protein Dthio_PD2079 [Desulfonatronospira thiodismutans ASO3-1]
MATYKYPSLKFTSKEPKTSVVPLFYYVDVLEGGKSVERYEWIAPNARNSFDVYNLGFFDNNSQQQLDIGHYQNQAYKVTSLEMLKKFKEVAPESHDLISEPMLPGKDDLEEQFISKVTQLQFEKEKIKGQWTHIVTAFTEILRNHFRKAAEEASLNHSLSNFFKGLTIGRSNTTYGFFMKGIKTAYDGLGFYKKTYSGLRFKNFGMNELISYIRSHRSAYPKNRSLSFDLVPGLTKISHSKTTRRTPTGPFTITSITDKGYKGLPREYMEHIERSMKHWTTHNQKLPFLKKQNVLKPGQVFQDRFMKGQTQRPRIVHEYGFRGDGRSPLVIYLSGGLHPNAVRHYDKEDARQKFEKYRSELNQRARDKYSGHLTPHFDPYLHQHNYDAISVFLSVSRSPEVALSFVNMGGGNGNIYVVRATGAIDQEGTFKRVQYPGEAEISVAGGVDWEDIVAVRPVYNGVPANYYYMNTRNKWHQKDKQVQSDVLAALMNISYDPDLDMLI